MPVKARGFTLIELVVTLAVVAALLAAVVSLFTITERLTRAEGGVADLQQSLRVAQWETLRLARMAGRGGLPRGDLPSGIAVAVRNNVPEAGSESRIAPADPTSPTAAPGSDVLILRGVFSTPFYQMAPATAALRLEGSPAQSGSVTVTDPGPGGLRQSLAPLIAAVERRLPEALLLVSPQGPPHYAVVELDAAHPRTDTSQSGRVVLGFRAAGGRHAESYRTLGSQLLDRDLPSVAQLGLLEEIRYYVRCDPSESEADRYRSCGLSRAWLYPATDLPHAGSRGNLGQELAAGVVDLQVALAVDRDADGTIAESDPPGSSDDWLFNHAADGSAAAWNRLASGERSQLYYLRLTMLGHSPAPDPRYLAPPLSALEDRAYDERPTPADEGERWRRSFRRRVVRTLVELRNLR
jgi:prepilin-type N-terminal cleavage/methylation domain-containing protein